MRNCWQRADSRSTARQKERRKSRNQPLGNGDKISSESSSPTQKGRRTEARRPFLFEAELEGLYVGGLQSFRTLGHFEFNRLAVVESLVAISQNGGEMDENVLPALALDEPKALAGIEPLHCTLFFTHCIYSFPSAFRLSTTLSYLMPRFRAPQQSRGRLQASPGWLQSGQPRKKKAASVTLRPLPYLKAIQTRATNASRS